MLKLLESQVIGTSIFSYLPPHMKCPKPSDLYKRLQRITESELNLPKTVFIYHPNGYLIEVYIRAIHTAILNKSILLLLLKERQTDHQFAILKDGIIQSYSLNFVNFTGKKEDNIIGKHVSWILPLTKDMSYFQPIYLNIKHKETAAILGYKEIGDFRFDYLMLIREKSEILS